MVLHYTCVHVGRRYVLVCLFVIANVWKKQAKKCWRVKQHWKMSCITHNAYIDLYLLVNIIGKRTLFFLLFLLLSWSFNPNSNATRDEWIRNRVEEREKVRCCHHFACKFHRMKDTDFKLENFTIPIANDLNFNRHPTNFMWNFIIVIPIFRKCLHFISKKIVIKCTWKTRSTQCSYVVWIDSPPPFPKKKSTHIIILKWH